jgi:hypothetical protein
LDGISHLLFSPDGLSLIFGGDENNLSNGVIKIWRISHNNSSNDHLISVNAHDGTAGCQHTVPNLSLPAKMGMPGFGNSPVKAWNVYKHLKDILAFFALFRLHLMPNLLWWEAGTTVTVTCDFGRLKMGHAHKANWNKRYRLSTQIDSPDGSRLLIRDGNWIFMKSPSPHIRKRVIRWVPKQLLGSCTRVRVSIALFTWAGVHGRLTDSLVTRGLYLAGWGSLGTTPWSPRSTGTSFLQQEPTLNEGCVSTKDGCASDGIASCVRDSTQC